MIHDVLDFFRKHLKEKGKNRTREQALILGAVLSTRDPFTADHLVKVLRPVEDLFEDLFVVRREAVNSTLLDLQAAGLVHGKLLSDGVNEYHKCLSLIKEIQACQPPQHDGAFVDLCPQTHKSLVAGVCPWCGRPVE